MTGNLTTLCDEALGLAVNPDYVRADCAGINTATNTSIVCPCCVCCDPNNATDCDFGDELAQYDPNWQTGFNRDGLYVLYNNNITR